MPEAERAATCRFENSSLHYCIADNNFEVLIAEDKLKHWIDHFFGYGSWRAPLWFVGFEETGGDQPEEVAEKINYFYDKHGDALDATLCDVRELYRQVAFRIPGPRMERYANFYDHRFGSNAVLHGLWKNLIAFAHGYRNKELPDLLTFQKNSFLTPSDDSAALLQLYPLPAHNHAWYYAWLDLPHLPFLKTRGSYEGHVYEPRIRKILASMSEQKPEVVLMYGMNNINTLKESIQDFYPGTTFKMMKGTKLQLPQYHRADINGTILLLTTQIPALRHNRIETGFDWELLGKTLRGS